MSEEYHTSLDEPTGWIPYRYHPSKVACVIFVALVGLITLLHIFLGVPQTEMVYHTVSLWWNEYVPTEI